MAVPYYAKEEYRLHTSNIPKVYVNGTIGTLKITQFVIVNFIFRDTLGQIKRNGPRRDRGSHPANNMNRIVLNSGAGMIYRLLRFPHSTLVYYLHFL